MKDPTAQADKNGKGNRPGAVGSVQPAEITIPETMGGLTLGQIAKMLAASRGSKDPSAQNNRMSGVTKSVVGATHARTKFPGGLLLVDSGAVDT